MAEQDHRQAGMPLAGQPAHRHDVGHDLVRAILPGKAAKRRIRCFRATVAAMVVGIDLETLLRHDVGKTAVTAGMFHKAVADHQHAAGGSKGGRLMTEGDGCARRGFQPLNPAECEVIGRLIHRRTRRLIAQRVIIMGS